MRRLDAPVRSAVAFYEVVLALHIMAVVVAFGVTFAYPIMFAVVAKADPRAPARCCTAIEYTIEQRADHPGLC